MTDESTGRADVRGIVVSFSGQLKLSYTRDDDFAQDGDEDARAYTLKPSMDLDFEYENGENYLAVVNLDYAREQSSGNGEITYESSLELDEAYLEISGWSAAEDLLTDLTLAIGRTKIGDSREWFYDESVDGLLLGFELNGTGTEFELSINRKEWIGSDLLRHDERDTVRNVIMAAEHEPFDGVDVGLAAYGIARLDDSADNDSPRFLGLRSIGELLDGRLTYWSDMAWVSGEHGDEEIDGHGFDIGFTYTRVTPLRPYVSIGYAFGSGDGDADTDFRQTDLQGNSGKFGGITSFKYYGELVDPELSNLHIATAGLGFRPAAGASLDLIYHRYEQDSALDELRDSNLDIDPNGMDTYIGDALDLVLGFDGLSGFETELVLGYFHPGSAFDGADDGFVVSAGLSYDF